ncbi:putative M18 family aminopeptidase 1 [Spirochaetia bacterium]|nr:putative M18 family aminopeptidase 1 [Spirochaetia bacterium]
MAEEEKRTEGQELSKKLVFEIKNVWETIEPAELPEVEHFAESYKEFLNRGKTERECTAYCMNVLKEKGFVSIENSGKIGPGSKIYQNIKGKALVFAIIGTQPIQNGINIVGAHVDSPRIDLKTNPLYEDSGLAFFDTQYYGGIKYYQWTAIPLTMHGVVIRKDGVKQTICIGEDDSDPVFTITDLLPHLADEQLEKKASKVVEGEELDILVGSEPYKDEKAADKVKLNILRLLNEKYGMVEEDFASAEIEFVPAFKARDVGIDRSMIGAYGHDDKCCAFAAFSAALHCAESKPIPEKTVLCLLTDKEEIGSIGNTGSESRFFENFIAFLASKTMDHYTEIDLRLLLSKSAMLSADVNAAYDPTYGSVYDKRTASHFGKGILLTKYTGHGGKFGGSDANAEFCQKVQSILNKNNIRWQYGGMGRVNKGGGGTIALYAANMGIEVLDCGIPVLSMHSPFEVISKIDLYTTYKGYTAFMNDA